MSGEIPNVNTQSAQRPIYTDSAAAFADGQGITAKAAAVDFGTVKVYHCSVVDADSRGQAGHQRDVGAVESIAEISGGVAAGKVRPVADRGSEVRVCGSVVVSGGQYRRCP